MPSFSKTQILIFIIIILLMVNIAMVLSFGMKTPSKTEADKPRRPNPIAFTLKEKVGFSEQQMQKIEELKKAHREKMHKLFEDVRKSKIDFYEHVNQDTIADSTIQHLSSDIGRKQQAIELQAFKNFRELRALCTPEQLPRYDSLMPQVIRNMWFPERHGGNGKHKEGEKDNPRS